MSQIDTPEDNGGQPVADDAANAATNAAPEPEDAIAEARERPPEAERAQDAASKRRRYGSTIAIILALTCVLFFATAVGFLWWQDRQFYTLLDQSDSDTRVSLQAIRSNAEGMEDQITGLVAANEAARALAADLGERVNALPRRFLDLEERLNATQGVSEDARRRWLRAEADYYLGVANAELVLAGRWENAMRALELADEKLVELASPALGGVRASIAAELMALRAVRLPDVEGLSYGLERLAEAGRTLSMRSAVPGVFATDGTLPVADVSGLARIWVSLKSAIAGMVSVERRYESVVRSLSNEDQALVRQQFELELVLARLGLVNGQPEVFLQSVMAAKDLLERHFDTAAVAVESGVTLLDEMALLDIAPERPDISGSLSLLRGLADRGN